MANGRLTDLRNEWTEPYDGKVFMHEVNQSAEIEQQKLVNRIEFQFIPEVIDWERQGNWVNVPIVGRNNSKKHLTGGEDRLSFQLDFNSLFRQDKYECVRKVEWLRSLTMTDGYAGPGRNVKLVWSNSELFRFSIWVVKRVKAQLSMFHSKFNMDPTQAIVDVELELDPTENVRLHEILQLQTISSFDNIKSTL